MNLENEDRLNVIKSRRTKILFGLTSVFMLVIIILFVFAYQNNNDMLSYFAFSLLGCILLIWSIVVPLSYYRPLTSSFLIPFENIRYIGRSRKKSHPYSQT